MSFLILDADFLCFTVATVFQEKWIEATHPTLGTKKFKNITELWGDWRKKQGGWLAEYNSSHFSDIKAEEFIIVECQSPLCLNAAKKSLDTRLQGLLEETGASSYKGFVGRGESFRSSVATLIEYKGSRKNALRPVHLTDLKQYMVDKHNCEWVESIECDDAVTSTGYAAYQKWKVTKKDSDKGIIVFEDKDLVQVDSWQYHVGQNKEPMLRVGLGEIFRDSKGKVRGWGRKHLFWQIMTSDTSDDYSANCFSDVKWGDVKGYDLLVECKTDKECFEALVRGFKLLYPEPKVVKGWRGEDIEIDWLYCLSECFNLAKMLRTRDEGLTNVRKVLDNLGVIYE